MGLVDTIRKQRKIRDAVFQGIVLLVSFFIPFLLFKTPAVLYQLLSKENLSVQTFKQYMLAKADFDSTYALADTESEKLAQNPIVKAPQDAKRCLEQGNIYSEEELTANLEKDQ
ncbi:hypothetical protein IJM86_03170 [bacterium]|nr:hypothetical protein [bacterium]